MTAKRQNGPMKSAVLMIAALPLVVAAQAQGECASNVAQLRTLAGDADFPLKWHETAMNDGKPLVVSISEKDGALVLEFVKTGEGLWAESTGAICRSGAGLEARFAAGQARLGPAANWVLRGALAGGGTFRLTRVGPAELRIATTGWSSSFAPRDK